MFSCYHKIQPIRVCLPNGSVVIAKHAGTIQFSPHLQINNVLYTPDFSLNLVSVSKLCQSTNCKFIFYANDCFIQDVKTKKMIGSANQVEGLYRLRTDLDSIPAETSISSISSSKPHVGTSIPNNCKMIPKQALWHFRLGHLSHDRLSKMAQMYPDIFNDSKAVCDVCHYARHKKLPYTLSHSKASQNFELLHFDIWGPVSTNSIHHHKYFLTAVDDHSRFTWIILLKNKSEVSAHVQQFVALIENQFHTCPKFIRSDNGPEFS